MDRFVKERNILDNFCSEFCAVIEEYCKYIVVSGFVAIATGRTRGTEDIDLIIEKLDKETFTKMHLALTKKGFVAMQSDSAEELYDYLNDNTSIRYTWKEKAVPEMEVKFAKDELDNLQLRERTKIPLTGLDIWFGSIEMNIAFKEDYLKSDKDLEDARHLRIVFGDQLSEEKINKYKTLLRKLR